MRGRGAVGLFGNYATVVVLMVGPCGCHTRNCALADLSVSIDFSMRACVRAYTSTWFSLRPSSAVSVAGSARPVPLPVAPLRLCVSSPPCTRACVRACARQWVCMCECAWTEYLLVLSQQFVPVREVVCVYMCVCVCVGVYMCGCVHVWVCKCVGVPVCCCVSTRGLVWILWDISEGPVCTCVRTCMHTLRMLCRPGTLVTLYNLTSSKGRCAEFNRPG